MPMKKKTQQRKQISTGTMSPLASLQRQAPTLTSTSIHYYVTQKALGAYPECDTTTTTTVNKARALLELDALAGLGQRRTRDLLGSAGSN